MIKRHCHVVLVVLALSTIGCVQAPTEEAEHAHYSFQPADFPDAVEKLTALESMLSSSSTSGVSQDAARQEGQPAPKAQPAIGDEHDDDDHDDDEHDDHEMVDAPPLRRWHLIVRWLPEVAADSDLKRESWERIADPARQLFDLTQPWEKRPESEQAELFRNNSEKLQSILRELEALAASEFSTTTEEGA